MMVLKKRVLFCATVDYHFKAFHLPYMKWFKERGWEVHVAASGDLELPYVDQKYNIPISRSPLSPKNWRAYKELKSIIDANQYEMIHAHTPVGGVLARIAARTAHQNGTKVFYTAHGFHFCNGAPIQNWLIYYPIERWLSKYTDCLITINKEDHTRAVRHGFKAGRIEHVHGVGVSTENFKPAEKEYKKELRIAYGYNDGDFLMFYAAEFNKNKNQKLLIQSLAAIKDKVPDAKLILAGEGELLDDCRMLAASAGVGDMVHFLGYRNDIKELLQIADIAVASSQREGLPVNILEAMACGLPIVALTNRGHQELVKDGENGFLISVGDPSLFGEKIYALYRSRRMREDMGNASLKSVKQFSLERAGMELQQIYSSYMEEEMHEAEDKHYRAYI